MAVVLKENQVAFLTNLAKLAYGHGGIFGSQKENGGKGYMGLIKCGNEMRMVKFCTHWFEKAKGKSACINASNELRKSISAFLNETFTEVPASLSSYVIGDNDLDRPLLSRTMVAGIVTEVIRNSNVSDLWSRDVVTDSNLKSGSHMTIDDVSVDNVYTKYKLPDFCKSNVSKIFNTESYTHIKTVQELRNEYNSGEVKNICVSLYKKTNIDLESAMAQKGGLFEQLSKLENVDDVEKEIAKKDVANKIWNMALPLAENIFNSGRDKDEIKSLEEAYYNFFTPIVAYVQTKYKTQDEVFYNDVVIHINASVTMYK